MSFDQAVDKRLSLSLCHLPFGRLNYNEHVQKRSTNRSNAPVRSCFALRKVS